MTTSIAWGFLCLLACLLTTHVINLKPNLKHHSSNRHQNLDGLKGILAASVFICHASSWQHYLAEDQWRVSSTPFYVLPAQTSVIIFFMLTGFLFCKKLIGLPPKKENWLEIYTGRFLRLAPVYFLMLFILIAIIGWGILRNYIDLSKCDWQSALSWVLFTIPGAPLLCEHKETNVIVSGVTWSLTYEWLFYFSLPILAKFTGKEISLPLLAFSISTVIAIAFALPLYSVVYLSFLTGIISAYIDHKHHSPNLEKKLWAGLTAMAILIINGFINTKTSYTASSVFLIGLSFHIFASGNSLAGFLKTRACQTLGLCTYSAYLLHGLALYLTLSAAKKFIPDIHSSEPTYWIIIILMTPPLVIFCLFIHVTIEFPIMQKTKSVAAFIEKKLQAFRTAHY